MKIKQYNITVNSVDHELPIADVPCNGCTHCCSTKSPLLTPEEFESAKYVYTIVNNNGNPYIGIPKLDTGCVYFKNNVCSIYENRPQSCRQYDCRTDTSPAIIEFVRKKFNE